MTRRKLPMWQQWLIVAAALVAIVIVVNVAHSPGETKSPEEIAELIRETVR